MRANSKFDDRFSSSNYFFHIDSPQPTRFVYLRVPNAIFSSILQIFLCTEINSPAPPRFLRPMCAATENWNRSCFNLPVSRDKPTVFDSQNPWKNVSQRGKIAIKSIRISDYEQYTFVTESTGLARVIWKRFNSIFIPIYSCIFFINIYS